MTILKYNDIIEHKFNEYLFNEFLFNKNRGDILTRAEEKEKRRQEIIEKSIDLFVRRGYYGTTVADIAKEVGMSVGLLFHYFDSKEKLYEEIIKLGLDATKSVMSFDQSNPIEFFTDVADVILTSVKMFPFSAKMFLLMTQATSNDVVSEDIHKLLTQIDDVEKSVEIIEKGQKDGTIRQGDPLALSVAYWCSITGIMQQLAIFPQTPIPKAEWIVDILRA